jgi:hypothetical protein
MNINSICLWGTTWHARTPRMIIVRFYRPIRWRGNVSNTLSVWIVCAIHQKTIPRKIIDFFAWWKEHPAESSIITIPFWETLESARVKSSVHVRDILGNFRQLLINLDRVRSVVARCCSIQSLSIHFSVLSALCDVPSREDHWKYHSLGPLIPTNISLSSDGHFSLRTNIKS